MPGNFAPLVLCACLLVGAWPAVAQQATVALGSLKQDTTLPVDIGADQLSINQADGTATFSGNVKIAQGDLRLAAELVQVEYSDGGKGIQSLHASGGVTFANKTDAAESREAVYSIDSGQIEMMGDVILTQGGSAISGQKLVIDLKAGTGVMEGRVQTVFQPGGN